jgi:cytochrome P450
MLIGTQKDIPQFASQEAAVEYGCANFDHHSPVHRDHSFEIYERLRETQPVARADAWGGYWVLTRYEDVKQVAQDDINFSAQRDGIAQPNPAVGVSTTPPIDLDPPLSTQIKRLLTPYFSPRAMERWIRDVEPLTAELVDAFIETGKCDFTYDVGMPLTGIITMRMSGIDDSKWHEFAHLVHKSIYFEAESIEEIMGFNQRVYQMCAEEVQLQKKNPRPGIVADLLKAELNGEPVSDFLIQGVLNLFMFGGLDTTQAVIGSALVHLSRNPAMKQFLRDNPEAIPTATEEYLRLYSPQQALFRTVINPVVVGGVEMKPGDRVMMTWAAANRDPAEFDNAKEFNPRREPNRHLAFGVGSHRCLGSNLARIEIQACLSQFVNRMPDFRVDESQLRLADDVGTVYGYRNVPITFTPGKKSK